MRQLPEIKASRFLTRASLSGFSKVYRARGSVEIQRLHVVSDDLTAVCATDRALRRPHNWLATPNYGGF